MLQPGAPRPYRGAELRWLQEQYGLSEVFGDEVPQIVDELMAGDGDDGRPAAT
jgi:hypothetical protein